MINYYEILGLTPSAENSEIKTAFRHLAKIYHPDVNPQGIVNFSKILKAYETLSDPILKSSYDFKLKYHQSYTSDKEPKTTKTKTWRFDEQELKRRQYYNDHIKKYEKKTEHFYAEAKTKKQYNEYKYILFATPLAVALFLFIMKFASSGEAKIVAALPEPETIVEKKEIVIIDTTKLSDLKMGDVPYTHFFGNAKYDTVDNQKLLIKNLSGADIIMCLFTKNKFIRSFYISDYYSAEISQLPSDPIIIKYSSGLNFDSNRELKKVGLFGAFKNELNFYKSSKPASINSLNELTLKNGLNEGFEKISEQEFFRKK